MTNVKLAALSFLRPFVLIAALASGVFAGCARDPVERELVGSWQTAISSPAGAWQVRFTTLSNGQYRTEFQGPFPMPAETGYFTARGGEWRIEKITGSFDEGTYEFLTDDSVLLQSAAGAVVWNRIATSASSAAAPAASDAFAPGLPPGAAPAPTVGASPAPASAQPGGAPSAELLATGPFGAALLEAPAATSPSPAGAFGTVPTTSPFGTPAPGGAASGAQGAPPTGTSAIAFPAGMPIPPAPFGVLESADGGVSGGAAATLPSAASSATAQQPPDGGATGAVSTFPGAALPGAPQPAPPTVGGGVGGVQALLEANARALSDAPTQALDDLEGAAEQVAADVIDQAAAPVTEAADEASQKVGQRIQTFGSNAGSRIKGFFTRGKRAETEEAAAAEEDKDR